MQMVGRKYSHPNIGYRYGFNKQERSSELNDNLYSAKYWEYDSRIGRRWNVDPIYNTDISRYAVNGNNPLYFLDPNGDFKTKFGAKWYKFWHDTKGDVRQNTTEGSNRNGEWFIQREGEAGKKGDGKGNLDEVLVYSPIYGDKKNGKQGVGDPWHQNPFPDIDKLVDRTANNVNRSVNYLKQNASDIWNSPIARAVIPDYYTLSFNFQPSSIFYVQQEGTFTLLLRGKDPGVYWNSTTSGGLVTAMGVDVGCSVGKGYFLGMDARKFDSKVLGGWQASGGAGLGVSVGPAASLNGGIDVGFGEDGRPTTVTGKVGISFGLDVPSLIKVPVSLGGGKATEAKKLMGF